MAVLVVGGAGYIGSVVVEELLKTGGDEVVVLDDLSRGHRRAVAAEAHFVRGDMADGQLVQDTLKRYNCSCVMHFSALSLVGESMEKPLLYYQNNVGKGIALVEAMLQAGINKIIFSSTAAVYGEPEKTPILEDHPTRPNNVYGRTKLYFEAFLRDCSEVHDLRYISLRYFNAAGATKNLGEDHRPETHLIPLILQVALGHRDKLFVYGDDYPTEDGSCIRDFIHVIDLAQAHILALKRLVGADPTPALSSVYNLGNGQGFSVFEMVNTAVEVTGRDIPFEVTSRRPGDPAVLVASSEKIKQELGWKPQYPGPAQIIESAWKWHQKFPQGYQE